MNKIQLVINIVLVAAVAALFALFFTNKPAEPAAVEINPSEVMPVAYFHVHRPSVPYTSAIEPSDT